MKSHADAIPTTELFQSYVVPTYGRFPLAFERGAGAWVWDEAGRKYLDFGAGIAVCSIGHCHPRVTEVMARQLGRLVHTSNLYYTRRSIRSRGNSAMKPFPRPPGTLWAR
jgi:acetylornithine/succinyldiaminopimelate/putrescine aminotransferase